MTTLHAQARSQQRSIGPDAIDAILTFGTTHRRNGADVYYLDRPARSRIERTLGHDKYRAIEKALDSYVVVADDGALITVAHRYRRLKF